MTYSQNILAAVLAAVERTIDEQVAGIVGTLNASLAEAAIALGESEARTAEAVEAGIAAAAQHQADTAALVAAHAEQLERASMDRDRLSVALAASEDALEAAIAEHNRRAEADEQTIRDYAQTIADREAANQVLADAIAGRDLTIAALEARIRELEAGEPAARRTVLGGTPWSGYASTTTRDATVARWGAGAAVRLFNRDASTLAVAPPRGDAGPLLVSWKPTSLAVITDDAVRAALANLVPGDMSCCWHEPDVKVKDEIKANGQAAGDTLAAFYKSLAWAWYTTAKRVRPDLDVFACSSAWLFDPTNASDNPARYFERRSFDVFGADYDGLSGPKDYREVTPRLQAWLESVDCTRYVVPEYGVKTRVASGSTPAFTNEMRPAWLNAQTTALLEDPWPPEIVCLYENDTSTEGRKYNLTTAPEKAEWDRLIELARD